MEQAGGLTASFPKAHLVILLVCFSLSFISTNDKSLWELGNRDLQAASPRTALQSAGPGHVHFSTRVCSMTLGVQDHPLEPPVPNPCEVPWCLSPARLSIKPQALPKPARPQFSISRQGKNNKGEGRLCFKKLFIDFP